jgi:hypothetical protein
MERHRAADPNYVFRCAEMKTGQTTQLSRGKPEPKLHLTCDICNCGAVQLESSALFHKLAKASKCTAFKTATTHIADRYAQCVVPSENVI